MKKTTADLPDGWKAKVIGLYKKGASDTEVRADLDMTNRLWKELLLTDVEFEDVILHGRMLARAWWLTQGRVNLHDKTFNALLYKINMQNRFNWSDKSAAVEDDDEDSYQDEKTLDEAIQRLSSESSH